TDHPPRSSSNDTATTKTYTLSLHDALPIYRLSRHRRRQQRRSVPDGQCRPRRLYRHGRRVQHRLDGGRRVDEVHGERRKCWIVRDRKSTRLNSSHVKISYAVFCLKKKKKKK